MKKIIFLVLSLGVVESSYADPVSINPRPRMMSMGNAGAGLIGDRDSAMMNPAGLADVTESRFQVLPILIQVPFSVGTVNSYLDLQDTLDNDSASNSEKRAKLEEFLTDVSTSAVTTRVNLNPSYVRKNLYIGASLDFNVDPRFRVGGATSNQVVEMGGSNGTGALILGYSHSLLDNRLKVGTTVKPLYRVALTANQEQTVYDLIKGQDPGNNMETQLLGSPKAARRAFGIGFDFGARYDLPFLEDYHPSVGLTYQDIGNTRFFASNSPANIDQSISLGLGFQKTFGIVKSSLAIDFRSINRNEELTNKLHMGAEAVIWNILAIRAGLSQLYWTVGAGLDVKYFQFDVFVTAYESGRAAHLRENRSLGTQLAFAF